MQDYVPQITRASPDHLVIQVGANDLCISKQPEEILGRELLT